jgi:hypothetical protein
VSLFFVLCLLFVGWPDYTVKKSSAFFRLTIFLLNLFTLGRTVIQGVRLALRLTHYSIGGSVGVRVGVFVGVRVAV